MYKILPVKHTNYIDIFQGEGWENWTRVRVNGGLVQHIKNDGPRISIQKLYEILKDHLKNTNIK